MSDAGPLLPRRKRYAPEEIVTPGPPPRAGRRYARSVPCVQCQTPFVVAAGVVDTSLCPACIAANQLQAQAKAPGTSFVGDQEYVTRLQSSLPEQLQAAVADVDPVIARELASRELVRRKLLHFTERFNSKYIAGWVHKLICEKLDQFSLAVARQRSPRLMIFLPPRHGKSELASVNFPALHLGRYSDHEIIACSYAVSLPESFSRRIKSIVTSAPYQVIFPNTTLDPNAQATSGWHTLQGGGYLPAGVGGGITGRGAHILLIDDPVKDSQDADSATVRNAAWDWYGSTARSRLAPGGGILVIQTRWNDDDLSGRILQQEAEKRKKEGWDVLIFPAIAEHTEYWSTGPAGQDPGRIVYDTPVFARDLFLRAKGEALHPERYSLDELEAQKSVLAPRFWSALYQQNPAPDDGEFFKSHWFRYEPEVFNWQASDVPTYIAWDLASSSSDTACYNVGVVGCFDYEGNIHLLDMLQFRPSELLGERSLAMSIIELYKKYRPKLLGIENGQILQAIQSQLSALARAERLPISYDETLKPVTDKTVRAQPLQGIMQHGQLYLPSNQPWSETLKQEFLRFPAGKTMDIVDATAWLVRMMLKEPLPRVPVPKKVPSMKEKLRLVLKRHGGSTSNAALEA